MNRAALPVVLAALALALPPAAAAPVPAAPRVTLSVEVSEPASLFNLVDRLADWRDDDDVPPERYRALWEQAAGPLSAEDTAALDAWRALRRRYRGVPDGAPSGVVATHAGSGLPFPVRLPTDRLEDRLALVFLAARDWDDLALRSAVLRPPDRKSLGRAVDHFRRRLGPVLRRSLHLEAYAARIRSWQQRRPVAPFLDRLARFLHAPDGPPLEFVLHPVWLAPDATETRATVVDDHAALEVREGLGLRGVVDVGVHELVHRLEERMPRDVRLRLEQAFLSAPEAEVDGTFAVAAANLWQEGLATALGQGLAAEQLFPEDFSRERAWYQDPGYDGFAKLLYLVAAPYLAEGRPMDEAFVHAVVRLYAGSFDSALPAPGDVLRRCVVLGDDPAARAAVRAAIEAAAPPRVLLDYPLADALAARETAARRALATFPAMPVVIVARDAEVARLPALPLVPRLDPAALERPVATVRRPRAGPVFVATGPDGAAAAAAFARFLAQSSPPRPPAPPEPPAGP